MVEPDARMKDEVASVEGWAWSCVIGCHSMELARLMGVIMRLHLIRGFINKEGG